MAMPAANLTPAHVRQRDWLAVLGAVFAAAAVALLAWAAHGVAESARASLQMAAQLALLHGIAVAALAPLAVKRLARIALVLMLVSIVLFTGSIVAGYLIGASTALAPVGGVGLIVAWLLQAWQRIPQG